MVDDFNSIVVSFLQCFSIYLDDETMQEMEASEYMNRVAALKDCQLSDLIYIRTASDETAKSFDRYQKEERKRYKEKIEKEIAGTDYERQLIEKESWAFWYSLKNKIPQEQLDAYEKKKSEEKE